MDGSLVLLSGGLDSAVALAWAQRHLPPVRAALHFSYGQKCEVREYEAAYRLADYYAVPWFHYIIPTFEYNATCPIHSEITPARNLIFMAYAESLCESQEIEHLVFGARVEAGEDSPAAVEVVASGRDAPAGRGEEVAVEGGGLLDVRNGEDHAIEAGGHGIAGMIPCGVTPGEWRSSHGV